MILLYIFIISVLFSFFDVPSLNLIANLMIICMLPGLCLIAIGKREKLLLQDILLAFPASIGICSLITIGLLFLSFDIKSIVIFIYCVIGILVFFIGFNKQRKEWGEIKLTKNEIKFCLYSLLVVLFLSIPLFIGPNRGPIANHAFHHSSFVSQILNGIFPPENPGLGGTMIGYYWGFHALIAAITARSGVHQLQIIFILNALSLYLVFCLSYLFSRLLNMKEGYRYLLPIIIIALMRSEIGIYFLFKLFSGSLVSYGDLVSKYEYLLPMYVFRSWVGDLQWLDTRMLYTNKVFNISAMPLAISFCLGYFTLLLLFLKKEYEGSKTYSLILSLIIIALIINYPPLAIIPLMHAPLWIIFLFLTGKADIKARVGESLRIIVPYGMAVLISIPYLLFIIASRDLSSSGQGGLFRIDVYDQSIKNIAVYFTLLPLIAIGAWALFKKMAFSREGLFLWLATALCLVLVVFTRWPFNNSYKFNYVLIFFFSLYVAVALHKLIGLLASRLVRGFVTTSFVFYLILTPIVVEAAYIVSCMSMEWYFKFSEGHIIYAQESKKNEAYEWIRNNTPPDSLIMLNYVETPVPYSGLNPNYEVAAISERNLFVIKDTDYTVSNPNYMKRIELREKLFNSPEDPEVVEFFKTLSRKVYLMVENNLPDRYIVEKRFENFPDNPGIPFSMVFKNKNQRIYRIEY